MFEENDLIQFIYFWKSLKIPQNVVELNLESKRFSFFCPQRSSSIQKHGAMCREVTQIPSWYWV